MVLFLCFLSAIGGRGCRAFKGGFSVGVLKRWGTLGKHLGVTWESLGKHLLPSLKFDSLKNGCFVVFLSLKYGFVSKYNFIE